jgi:hypothetical protein
MIEDVEEDEREEDQLEEPRRELMNLNLWW